MGVSSEVQLMRTRPALSFPISGVTAVVCTGCGRTTLFANDLGRITEEVRKHPGDFEW